MSAPRFLLGLPGDRGNSADLSFFRRGVGLALRGSTPTSPRPHVWPVRHDHERRCHHGRWGGEERSTWLTLDNFLCSRLQRCLLAAVSPTACPWLGMLASTSCTFCCSCHGPWRARNGNGGEGAWRACVGEPRGGCEWGPSLVVGRSPLAGWHRATWRPAPAAPHAGYGRATCTARTDRRRINGAAARSYHCSWSWWLA